MAWLLTTGFIGALYPGFALVVLFVMLPLLPLCLMGGLIDGHWGTRPRTPPPPPRPRVTQQEYDRQSEMMILWGIVGVVLGLPAIILGMAWLSGAI